MLEDTNSLDENNNIWVQNWKAKDLISMLKKQDGDRRGRFFTIVSTFLYDLVNVYWFQYELYWCHYEVKSDGNQYSSYCNQYNS